MTQEIVVPGQQVARTGECEPGSNTYVDGDGIFALRVGIKRLERDRVDVVALGGIYDPQPNDLIIVTVLETGPSNWYLDARTPMDVGMHVNEVPWRVEFGETARYLDRGDSVVVKVYHVDELRRPLVSMKDRICRKLEGGFIVDVEPARVGHVIGANNSMIDLLKHHTGCRIFIGINGRIWIDGEAERVAAAAAAVRLIETEAHAPGLTERVRQFLEDRLGAPRGPERREPPAGSEGE